jgi:DNA invertase Pin-like site-specific DNA recombinase
LSRKIEYDIRHVAVYLRKSRGSNNEEIDDLKNHRDQLIGLCEDNNWSYTLYEEIGTGDKIDVREKMVELLDDVYQGMYDAIVAVHLDRLSRGDEADQARIKKTLALAESYFVTPYRTYDFNDESDILTAEIEGLGARLEYKQIARRFRQGKARRAKAGFWSNGVPPFPYVRDVESGKAVPVEENLVIYRRMIDMALNGWVADDIAWELNKEGIPSPRGQLWQPAVVRRLITDEVHLGKIVVGKKRKLVGADAIVRKPKDEWIVHNNCHQAVKTQLEHDKIMFIIQRDKAIPTAARAGANTFSGLIRCAKCGSTLQIQKRTDRPSDLLKSCKHRDPFGVRCECIGGQMNDIEVAVKEAIMMKMSQLEDAIRNGVQLEDIRLMLELAEGKLAEIKKLEKRLSGLEDMRLDGEIDKERYMLRKAEIETQVRDLEGEYQVLMTQADNSKNARNEDMLETVKRVLNVIDKEADPKDMNRAYKSIIHSIIWERESIDEQGSVTVNFL